MSNEAHAATPVLAGLREIVTSLTILRPLWRLAGYVLLTSALAVAHVAIRLESDRLQRELATVEAQAGVAQAWNEALALDLETRRSTERLEQVASEMGLTRPDQVKRIIVGRAQ